VCDKEIVFISPELRSVESQQQQQKHPLARLVRQFGAQAHVI